MECKHSVVFVMYYILYQGGMQSKSWWDCGRQEERPGCHLTRNQDQISTLQCTALHCSVIWQIADYNGDPAAPWTTSAARGGVVATFLVTLSSGLIHLRCWDLGRKLLLFCAACWPNTALTCFLSWLRSELFSDMKQLFTACWSDRDLNFLVNWNSS